jgi:hypothetical protein
MSTTTTTTTGRCDVCGRSSGNHVISKNYNDLYLTILKIGQSRVSTGLKYSDLIRELATHGYDTSNDCVVLAIKRWFLDSFFHLPDHHNPCNDLDDLNNHTTCHFILKGDSSLALIEHETMERSIRQARNAILLSILALLLSLLTIGEVHDWVKAQFSRNNMKTSKPLPHAVPTQHQPVIDSTK